MLTLELLTYNHLGLFMQCPCQSGVTFKECCLPFLQQKDYPQTPEALMRSRYSAYVKQNTQYIIKTMKKEALSNYRRPNKIRLKEVQWKDLKVLNSYYDESNPNIAFVEFIASYIAHKERHQIQELSRFELIEGRWYYVGEELPKP